MFSYFLIAFTSFGAACLTLYSGFGLGTILLPVFTIFFPVQSAIAATAVVHGSNNLLKLFVLGKYADWQLVMWFGLPAVLAAFFGASLMTYTAGAEAAFSYSIGSLEAIITPLKLSMSFMMLFFAMFELVPALSSLRINRKYIFIGGLLSGFFGGFSGHQGALRSTFLTKLNISTESFVGTNAVIGFMVDAARIFVYGIAFWNVDSNLLLMEQWPLLVIGTMAAFAGVLSGKYFLRKMTMKIVKNITGVLLLIIAVALGMGVI